MVDNFNVRLESIKKIESGINITAIASAISKSNWTNLVSQDEMVNFAKNVIQPHESSSGITYDEFPGNELTNLALMAKHSMWNSLTHINVSIQEFILNIKKPNSVFIASVFTNFASMASIYPESLYALNTQHTEYANKFYGNLIPKINVVSHQDLVENVYAKTFDVAIVRFDYISVDQLLLSSIINSIKDDGIIMIPGSSDQGELYRSVNSYSEDIHKFLNEKCTSVIHLPIGTGLTICNK